VTDLSHDSPDDGFHEIQLSGKQLVFLFMATTVVSVVIFLCGVLVGRGVRAEALKAADRTTPVSTGGASPTVASAQVPPPPVAEQPTAAAPALSYTGRLQAEKAVPETLKPQRSAESAPVSDATAAPAEPPVAKPPSAVKPEALAKPEAPASTPAPAPRSTPTVTTPPQPGVWAVQVVALTDPGAAEAVVRRLHAKGYSAFVVNPQSGAPVQNYKVQVGKFETRSEAEQIAGRLKKEEQFQPWILR
jgi:cell division septation protein DedD